MNKVFASIAVVALAAFGLGLFPGQSQGCINVYVDYGPLNNGAKTEVCVDRVEKTSAIDIIENAGFTLEGTQKYGNAVVCRVNGLPDKSVESCQEMPPAKAYWAVLVKEHQIIPIPFGLGSTWGWAQTGINEIYLDPGDSIGLVFADNGEVVFP